MRKKKNKKERSQGVKLQNISIHEIYGLHMDICGIHLRTRRELPYFPYFPYWVTTTMSVEDEIDGPLEIAARAGGRSANSSKVEIARKNV